jgi:hypothetical protein
MLGRAFYRVGLISPERMINKEYSPGDKVWRDVAAYVVLPTYVFKFGRILVIVGVAKCTPSFQTR